MDRGLCIGGGEDVGGQEERVKVCSRAMVESVLLAEGQGVCMEVTYILGQSSRLLPGESTTGTQHLGGKGQWLLGGQRGWRKRAGSGVCLGGGKNSLWIGCTCEGRRGLWVPVARVGGIADVDQ